MATGVINSNQDLDGGGWLGSDEDIDELLYSKVDQDWEANQAYKQDMNNNTQKESRLQVQEEVMKHMVQETVR